MSAAGTATISDGELTIELVTDGELHAVVSAKTNFSGTTILCGCGLLFAHSEAIEAAKGWYEHRWHRTQTILEAKA